jgi:hypothetical protein
MGGAKRENGKKAKYVKPDYKKLDQEPLNHVLQENIGALFDLAAHFTPDFFIRYDWKHIPRAGGGYNVIAALRKYEFESGFFVLASEHSLIFEVFDRCQDGAMLRHPDVAKAFEYAQKLHCRLGVLSNTRRA